jgi:hypothetical protein
METVQSGGIQAWVVASARGECSIDGLDQMSYAISLRQHKVNAQEDIALLGIFSEYIVNMITMTPGTVFFKIAAVSTPFMVGFEPITMTLL